MSKTHSPVYRCYGEFAKAHLHEEEGEPDVTTLGQVLARETVEYVKSHLDRLMTPRHGVPKETNDE